MTTYKREPAIGWENMGVSDCGGQIHYSLLGEGNEFSGITINSYISEDSFEIIFQKVKNLVEFEKILNRLGYEIDPLEKIVGCCMIKITRLKVPEVLRAIKFISTDLFIDICKGP